MKSKEDPLLEYVRLNQVVPSSIKSWDLFKVTKELYSFMLVIGSQ